MVTETSEILFLLIDIRQEPQVIVQMDNAGQTHGHVHIFGARQKVRRDLTPNESALTKRTRKLEACGRCKAFKQRVCSLSLCTLLN